jgi:hypothetical protein
MSRANNLWGSGQQPRDQLLVCQNKIAYGSEEEADGARAFLKHKYGKDQRWYKCRFCHAYHLTTKR